MQAAAGRDRIYVLTLVLTLVAICAFGVFVIRDYQDQGSQKVGLARLGGATTGGPEGDAALPSSGDSGAAAAPAPAGGTSAGSAGTGAASGAAGTGAGSAAGSSVSGSGSGAAAVAARPGGSGGASSGGGSVPAPVAGPGGTSPACVNGHIRIGQIVAITGPLTMQTAANATAAYFKKVNAEGGINGCQVDFT